MLIHYSSSLCSYDLHQAFLLAVSLQPKDPGEMYHRCLQEMLCIEREPEHQCQHPN